MRTLYLLIVNGLMLYLISGCALFHGVGPQTTVNLQSVNYLNPDVNGRASPLVVTLYQLKTPYAFKQASADQLINNSAKSLANSLIDKQTVIIKPSSQQLVHFPVAAGTNYIGVLALYRNINQANWHEVVKINPKKDAEINVLLESNGLSINHEKQGFSL